MNDGTDLPTRAAKPSLAWIKDGRKAVAPLLSFATSVVPSVCVMFHHDRSAIATTPPEENAFCDGAGQAAVCFVPADQTDADDRDTTHLNATGQKAPADTIERGCLARG